MKYLPGHEDREVTWTFDELVEQTLDLIVGASVRLPESEQAAFFRKLERVLNLMATADELAAEGVDADEFDRRLLESVGQVWPE